ncbi:hypothetical protein OAB57_03065 [Bacteriovoracaceae bacterium]|nr:hypothetical protein [Bacteriovoracaceae bacterium]
MYIIFLLMCINVFATIPCPGVKNQNLIHMIWIGESIENHFPDLPDKIEAICNKTEKNFKTEIILWFEDNSKPNDEEIYSIPKSVRKKIDDSTRPECEGIQITYKPISELTSKNEKIGKGYDFFRKNGIYSGSVDILKLAVLQEYGGCYFDVGVDFTDSHFNFNALADGEQREMTVQNYTTLYTRLQIQSLSKEELSRFKTSSRSDPIIDSNNNVVGYGVLNGLGTHADQFEMKPSFFYNMNFMAAKPRFTICK